MTQLNPFDELNQKLDLILLKLDNRILTQSDDLLTINDAAELLDLSKATLYGYTHRGAIPFTRRNRKLYFSKTELIDWLYKKNEVNIDNDNINQEP